MWKSPGAIQARPGLSRHPELASWTSIGDWADNRSAKQSA